MGLGFDPSSFLRTHIKPMLQDPGISKRLIFYSVLVSTKKGGKQEKIETSSVETRGIIQSNPVISEVELKQVISGGDVAKEVVKIFFVESDLDFRIKEGYNVEIYNGATLIGNYRVKVISRNMIVTDVAVALCVMSR